MSLNVSLTKVFNPRPGWYRGNFHAHTHFSEDGYYTPAQLLELAKAEGLDFCAVTDHNTIEACAAFGPDAELLMIPGLEVTLTDGHFNVFGLTGWLDWMEHVCIGQSTVRLNGNCGSTTELMRQIAGHGLLNSINHPHRGFCEWRDGTTELRYVNCVEIWNKPSWPENRYANLEAIGLWTEWLNAGYRITAIGGSDYHGAAPEPGQAASSERLGLPSTYVYATELSGAAILAGLRQRRAYVSMGPQVTFQAHANGTLYNMGADLGELSRELLFTATVSGSHVPACARIVKNGQVVTEVPVEAGQTQLEYSDKVASFHSAWYRLDVFDSTGQMLAMTNPIFVGLRRRPELQTYGDFINSDNAGKSGSF